MKRTRTLSLLALLVMICVVLTCAFVACKKDNDEIKLSQTELNLDEGGAGTLTATVPQGYAAPTWNVVPADVVELTPLTSQIYTVVALKVGEATITVSSGDLTATCAVTVSAKEVVTVKHNGVAVTTVTVEMGETLQLEASSNRGSAITAWTSSNERMASVDENGLVRGLKAGPDPVIISAQVTASIKADVVLYVTSASGYVYYDIPVTVSPDKMKNTPDMWECWTEWGQFAELSYDNGIVTAEFSENAGAWYNIQLVNIDSQINSGKYYKMSVKIDSSDEGHVTINGNVVALQEGEHTYEIYFTGGNGFSIQFGVDGVGIDMFSGKVVISDINYEEDNSRVQLVAPDFDYDESTGVITIHDNNPEGIKNAGVKNYVLNLYKNNVLYGSVTLPVAESHEIDWSMIRTGTYQAKLYALAANSHYIESGLSAAKTINVENDDVHYSFHNEPPVGAPANTEMDANGVVARRMPGIWTFWSSWWVDVDGQFANNKLTLKFSNNSGLWYDTQLFYRHPDLSSGKEYILKLKIDSDAEGRITLNGDEFVIEQGEKVYSVVFTENGGLSMQFTLGLSGQDNAQDITAATMIFEIVSVDELVRTKLTAPSFTREGDHIKITDPNAEGAAASYELGFFQSGVLKKTLTVVHNETIDLSKIPAGTYDVRIRAVAAKNSEYETSDWSVDGDQMTSDSQYVEIDNGVESDALKTPGSWIEWHDQNWEGANITIEEASVDGDGNVTIVYSATGKNWFGLQLYYKYSSAVDNQLYKLTMKIDSSVEGNITINGVVVSLVVGENDIELGFRQQPGKPTITIQFGVQAGGTMISGGEFAFRNISISSTTATTLSAPSFTLNSATNVITITDSNTEGVSHYELGFFQGSTMVTSITVENNKAIDISQIPAGTYTVKLRAVGKDARYATSAWSTSEAEIKSNNNTIEILPGAEDAAGFTSGWRYYSEGTSVSECYLDTSNNTIHITYSGKGQWYGTQLFYKTDEVHAYTITIKSSVAGQITVCGKVVTLTAGGTATVEVPSSYRSWAGLSKIDIQFGVNSSVGALANGGTFEITYTAK